MSDERAAKPVVETSKAGASRELAHVPGGPGNAVTREEEEPSAEERQLEDGVEGVAAVPGFEERLKVALQETYPVFNDRVQRAHFADWHRRSGLELDLAHSAMLAVFRHCLDHRFIPNDLVGYLVTTARNLAIAAWKDRRDGLVRSADLDRIPIKHGRRQPRGLTVPVDEVGDLGTENKESETCGDQEEPQEQDTDQAELTAPMEEVGQQDDSVEDEPENYITEQDGETSSAACDSVRAAIDGLPRRQREAIEIYMRHREECTFSEMGRMMVPPNETDAFEKNVERAIKALRKALAAQGFARP